MTARARVLVAQSNLEESKECNIIVTFGAERKVGDTIAAEEITPTFFGTTRSNLTRAWLVGGLY
jgi:hypothetical protein